MLGNTGNISPVQKHARKDWPPKVAGKEMWRSAVAAVLPWYWCCPTCSEWLRASEAMELAEYADKHWRIPH